MSRRDRVDRDRRPVEPPQQGSLLSPGFLGGATLVGVVVVLGMNFVVMTRTQTIQTKVEAFEGRLTQLGRNVDTLAKSAASPRQQGPDPNKVYTVKTQGAPVEGPEGAAVTIAEFSDFQ